MKAALFFLFILTSSIALGTSSNKNLTLLSLRPALEEISSSDSYLEHLETKRKTLSKSAAEETFFQEDFKDLNDIFDSKEIKLKRFLKTESKLLKKISSLAKNLDSKPLKNHLLHWSRLTLKETEKKSLSYVKELKSKKVEELDGPEKQFAILLQTFKAPTVASYVERGFTEHEARYIRMMSLFETMLDSMKTNFDPEIYFHIESCMNIEKKFVVHARLDEVFEKYSKGQMICQCDSDRKLQDLFQIYYTKKHKFENSLDA